MNVGNKAEFVNELLTGINFGYDAKFIIHPIQYTWLLESIDKLPDYIWAKKIIDKLPEGRLDSNHQPFKIDGKIVEKPHIHRALKIIKKYDSYGK
jgi:citrate lyase beta subunit